MVSIESGLNFYLLGKMELCRLKSKIMTYSESGWGFILQNPFRNLKKGEDLKTRIF